MSDLSIQAFMSHNITRVNINILVDITYVYRTYNKIQHLGIQAQIHIYTHMKFPVPTFIQIKFNCVFILPEFKHEQKRNDHLNN
jgi:hypothetical protein